MSTEDPLLAAVERLRARHASVHDLDCELTMTAGFHGPCTCGWADALPLLADLLDEIDSTAGDDGHRLNEIRAAAVALASHLTEGSGTP